MKFDKVGTTLKHHETINGNAKNLRKMIEKKRKENVNFYFKNLILQLQVWAMLLLLIVA